MTRRASDFWITDRRQDIAQGGMSRALQTAVLDELEASRAREKELEAALGDPNSRWHERTICAVAEVAARLLPPVPEQGTTMRSVWIGNLALAMDQAIHQALGEVGLIGGHHGVKLQAKLLLPRMREDVRAALSPRPIIEKETRP